MARQPRKKSESGAYHVICTGSNHTDIFLDEEDKTFFKKQFFKYAKELGILIFAFIIMDNHFHAEIGKASENISLLMKKVCNSYAYYYNHKYTHTGPVFNGRFKSRPIESFEDLLTVCRYINQNAQKAGICQTLSYPWSSFNLYKNLHSNISKIFLDYFGSYKTFISFLSEKNNDICMEYKNTQNNSVSSDETYSIFIKTLFHLNNSISISNESKQSKDEKIYILRHMNISPSVISRLTGIPIGYIYKL